MSSVSGHPYIRRAYRVRHAVDGQHPRTTIPGQPANEAVDGFRGRLIGQHYRRLGIGEYCVEPLGVPGELRGEQRHRDVPRLNGGEEADDVIQALRSQDRHPAARLGYLLEPGRHRAGPRTKLRPVQIDRLPIGVAAEIDVPVGEGVVRSVDSAFQIMVDGVTVRQQMAPVSSRYSSRRNPETSEFIATSA